jgi:uncharacterized protein (TIGR03118 family)
MPEAGLPKRPGGETNVIKKTSHNVRGRAAKAIASLTFLLWIPLMVHAAPPGYVQTNLVSDIPGLALHTDPTMLNPWGVAFFTGSPFWINENNAGISALFDGTGFSIPALPSVAIPAPGNVPGGTPTGIVANTFPSAFNIGDLGSALFIFDTEDGTIEAWNLELSPITSAVIVVDNSEGGSPTGAVYKGLALATVDAQPYLYATNFRSGKIDVFDGNFNQVTLGSFKDPKMEKGYAPFGIQTINGNLWVTYTVQDAAKHDPVNRPNHGIVDIFDPSGKFIRRFVGHNRLNSPWAVVITPSSFKPLAGKVLIGNFGDGRIPAYDLATGNAIGYLRDTNGKMISLPGLWALTFSDALNATPGALYFTAGLNHEMDGLFGTFTPEVTGH